MLAILLVSDREMNRSIRYLCLFAAVAAILCASSWGGPKETGDSAEAKAKLAQVREQIAALTSRLGARLKDRDALAARLRDADLVITAKRKRLEDLRAEQLAAEAHRQELRIQEARIQSALDTERAFLDSQVRAAYLIGRQEQLKLLFNQGDPASAGRMLTFYGYFARARAAKIGEISQRVAHMDELVEDVDRLTENLRTLQLDTTREVADLQRARGERATALAAVAQQVSSGNQELVQLKREEQAEESLLADLARVLQDFPIDPQQSFAGLRGRLPWPVPGRITARYQDPRAGAAQSGLRWNGVLIDAARGAKVRAPSYGRVVYADWLQGLGLLLIIGHSGNYMTLYGHAEVLYKAVGDQVQPGDVIAALGESSVAAPQLYFEIREGRKAVDPKIWLKPAP